MVLGAAFSLMFFVVDLTSCSVGGVLCPKALTHFHYLAIPDDNVFFSIVTSGFEIVS